MHPPSMDPEKLKAVIAGYSQGTYVCHNFCVVVLVKSCSSHLFIVTVGKAFVAGTILVFGGATAVLLYTVNKLQLHSVSHATGSRLNNIKVNILIPTFKKIKISCVRFANRKNIGCWLLRITIFIYRSSQAINSNVFVRSAPVSYKVSDNHVNKAFKETHNRF